MYSPPSSPLSIGGVLDEGIRLFRLSFGRCWLLALIPGLIIVLFEMASGFPRVAAPGGGLSTLTALGNSPRLLLFDLLAFVLRLLFQGAVLVREIAIVHGDQSMTLGGAVAASVRRLPATVLGAIIVLLPITASAVPFGFAVVYFMARGTLPSRTLVLGLVLLIVATWLWGRLQLWFAALFLEDATAGQALGSSWRLTKGHWWRATAIFTVAVIMVLVVAFVFSFIGGVVAVTAHTSLMGRALLLQVFALGSNAIYYPLGGAIWLAMYHDLKLRREGGDLASRAGALSGTV